MTEKFRASFVLMLAALLSPAVSFAAQVRGSVDASQPAQAHLSLGYTKTRVASQAPRGATARGDVAVFLAAKESGVIPAPTESYKVSIVGLELKPNIAACVLDGKITFTNEDRTLMTVEIEEQLAGTIPPGQSLVYECKTSEPKLRRIRVKEWPHMRGGLFVGEVGVVASVNANGAFSMAAPQGKYEVQVIGESGPLVTKPIEVKAGDVDVGKLLARDGAASATDTGTKQEPERPVIEPAKDPVVAPPVRREPPLGVKKEPVPGVKKEPSLVTPVLPTKDKLIPAKKREPKEPSPRPSEDAELDFGEQ